MALLVLTAAVFWRALNAPFIHDDIQQIASNPKLHDGLRLGDVLQSGNRIDRPLLNLLYSWAWAVGGGATWPFHLLNLCVHLTNGVLLSKLLGRWLGRGSKIGYLSLGLFLLHPLQIQGVTYVMGLVSSLQCLWVFSALLLYRSGFQPAVLSVLVLAVMTKPTGVLIPFFLGLQDWTVGRKRFKDLPWKLLLTYFIAGVIALGLLEWVLPGRDQAEVTGFHLYPPIEYLLTQFHFLARYLVLMLDPSGQSLIHDYPRFTPRVALWAGLGVLAVSGAVFASVRMLKKAPLVAFLTGFFFLTVLPTNGPLQMINPFDEYRLYQANLAAFVLLAAFLVFLGQKWLRSTGIRATAFGAIAIYFVAHTWFQLGLWNDPLRVYEESLQHEPDSYLLHLGAAYYLDERGAGG